MLHVDLVDATLDPKKVPYHTVEEASNHKTKKKKGESMAYVGSKSRHDDEDC